MSLFFTYIFYLIIITIFIIVSIVLTTKKKINIIHLCISLCVLILFLIFTIINMIKLTKPLTPRQIMFVHKRLKSLLKRVTIVLHKHNYNYFINGGTLLGCIREGDIIKHDDDIDLGMLDTEINRMLNDKELIEDLRHNNIKIELPTNIITKPCHRFVEIKKKYNDKSNVFIDLFSYSIFNKDKDTKIYQLSSLRNRKLWPNDWFHLDELFPLRMNYLGNIKIHTPNKSITYLNRYYGRDWRIPKKSYNSHHNVILNLNDNCYGECFTQKR